MDLMADEESILDTVSSAVEEQKSTAGVEPGPQIKETREPEPDAEPEEPKSARDPSGRFLPKTAKAEGTEEEPTEAKPVEKPEEPTKPDISRPPKRLPIRTKGIWQTLPEPLREDIIAREAEFDKAFKRYDGLGLYAAEAEKNGTNLQTAFKSYSALESLCRNDPVAGVESLAQMLNWNPQALAHALAVKYGVLLQDGHNPGMQQPPQQATMPQGLTREQMEAEFERRDVATKISAFQEDPKNVYFDDVRPEMARLVNAGLANNLQEAYDKACRLNPEIARLNGHAANDSGQIRKTAAVDRSRAAAKAIGGAPSHGSNAQVEKSHNSNQSIRDSIKEAIAKQRGSA
jgi:hypothetical protein